MGNSLLFQIFERGGWVMYPLALCSFLALAIIVERFFFGLKKERVLPRSFLEKARGYLNDKKVEHLEALSQTEDTPVSRLLAVAVSKTHAKPEKLSDSVEAAGRKEAMNLGKYNNALGTIAAVSPLLGLLGTVFGMIQTFDAIESVGLGNVTKLAGGISEALITTAVGLSIAIPSLVMHRYFREVKNNLVSELESFAEEVVKKLA